MTAADSARRSPATRQIHTSGRGLHAFSAHACLPRPVLTCAESARQPTILQRHDWQRVQATGSGSEPTGRDLGQHCRASPRAWVFNLHENIALHVPVAGGEDARLWQSRPAAAQADRAQDGVGAVRRQQAREEEVRGERTSRGAASAGVTFLDPRSSTQASARVRVCTRRELCNIPVCV